MDEENPIFAQSDSLHWWIHSFHHMRITKSTSSEQVWLIFEKLGRLVLG